MFASAGGVCFSNDICVSKGTGDFDSAFKLVHEIFSNAKGFKDTIAAQATNIYVLGGSDRKEDAIKCGLKVLGCLGVTLPAKVKLRDIAKGIRRTQKLLKGRSTDSLLRLPVLQDADTIAAMHMLNLLFVYAFLSKMELAPFIGFKMVEITVEQGLCAVSCVGFALYAMVLSSMGNEIDEGYVSTCREMIAFSH